MIRKEIINQYVSSLREDSELDYIFPLLLERMGYRILSTPKQSKGQPQYGRDVVALKKHQGTMTLWLFELKGFRAKDITDRTLNEPDGIIESLNASKYTKYRDASIPELSKYPRRYVLAHNGTVEANAMRTLSDYVEEIFPEGNFERWDLFYLTDLFSKFLFDETLLTDEESYRLFKRVLVLLDSEGNDYSDIVRFVDLQISRMDVLQKIKNERSVLNFFATLRLTASMVYFYAEEDNNLYPAKFCIDTIVLKTWAWILRHKKEKSKKIMSHFNSLVLFQLQVYETYLNKILKFAVLPKGLYSYEPTDTEYLFYPLRCFDFLGDLIYYYEATEAYLDINEDVVRGNLDILHAVIENNPASCVPLLDTHSIPILMLFRYVYLHGTSEKDCNFIGEFIIKCIINISKRHNQLKIWPEMKGSKLALARSIYAKSDDYCTDSSLLILTLFELMAYMNLNMFYDVFKKTVEESKVNLQIAYPVADENDIEQILFEHRLYDELSVATGVKLPPTLAEFKESFQKPYESITYRTDKVGYRFLRTLAHKYYETDFFPDYLGRQFCTEVSKD